MTKFLVIAMLLCSVAACSQSPTAPSSVELLQITPGSVKIPLNSSRCFTVKGGLEPYTYSLRFETAAGITTTTNIRNCVDFNTPAKFELTVISNDGQHANVVGTAS